MTGDTQRPLSSLGRGAPVLAALALVAADQATKMIIVSRFHMNESLEVIPGFFSIVYIRNRGAAFGMLSNIEGEWVSRGFMIVALVAIVAIAVLYRSLPSEDRASRASLVLIGSGALGNLIDRARYGSVTDFLLFYIGEYQWPAFNVADSCITIGVFILGYALMTTPPKKKKPF